MLPHLHPLRPPQEIQGRLVKTCLRELHNQRRLHRWWRARSPLVASGAAPWWLRSRFAGLAAASGWEPLTPEEVYHVWLQPCADRKIEAARPAFEVQGPGGPAREVDTVLTAAEVLELLSEAAGSTVSEVPAGSSLTIVFEAIPLAPLDGGVLTDLLLGGLGEGRPLPLIAPVSDRGSGGFLEHTFREAALELFGVADAPLRFRRRQNEDWREVLLEDGRTKEVLLRFVAAYGFRNIQNVIRRATKEVTSVRAELGDFVEILACPGGCLNGGGQAPAPAAPGGEPRAAPRASGSSRPTAPLAATPPWCRQRRTRSWPGSTPSSRGAPRGATRRRARRCWPAVTPSGDGWAPTGAA